MHVATPEQLAEAVRRARRESGLTQEQVALAVGVGVRFVGELERGKSTVELGKALRTARALGLVVEVHGPGVR